MNTTAVRMSVCALLLSAVTLAGAWAEEAPPPAPPTPPATPPPAEAAQPPAPTPPQKPARPAIRLSVKECIEIAVQNNLGLRIGQLSDRAVDLDLTVAWAKFLPNLTGEFGHGGSEAGGQHFTTVGVNGGVTERTPWGTTLSGTVSEAESHPQVFGTPSKSTSVGISATQPLWKGRSPDVNMKDIHQAQINKLISRGNLETSLQNLIFSVRKSYYDCIRQLQNRETNQRAVESATTFLHLTEVREKAGQATKLDIFNAEVQLSDRQLALTANERDLEAAFDALKQSMDVDLDETLAVEEQPIDFGDKPPAGEERVIESDLAAGTVKLVTRRDGKTVGEPVLMFRASRANDEKVLSQALANRIDLLNARRGLALQKINALVAADGLNQQVDLVAGYTRSGAGAAWSTSHSFRDNDYNVGVKYSLPWGKVADKAAYERALLDLEHADIALKAARTTVQSDVRNLLRQLKQGEVSLLIQGKKVEQNKRLVEAERVRFERGLKDSFDLITAEDNLLTAKVNFINSRLDYLTQLANLDTVVGIPTGRVDLSGQTPGGAVKSQIPPSLTTREAPKRAPVPMPAPEDNP